MSVATGTRKPFNPVRGALYVVLYALLIFWAVVELYPLVFLFYTALKTDAQIMSYPWALPDRPHFENFAEVWSGGTIQVPIPRYLLNSVVITGLTLLILTFAGTLAGYALARYQFPGAGLSQRLFIWALAIPVHATLVPVFLFMGDLGLRNTYWGIAGLYAAFWLPFTVVVMRAYFESFPRELEESARIDGCTDFGVFWRIVLPISRGSVASISIVNVVGIWSELLFAFVLLNKPDMRTLTVGVLAFKGEYTVSWGLIFAGLAIATLPTLLFFLFFQRQITKGMTMGAFR
jgi:ABC-type glycerol-3-phosphate transport system permease component